MHIDSARIGSPLIAPYLLQKHFARSTRVRMRNEIAQEPEFFHGEFDRQTTAQDLYFVEVHRHGSKAEDRLEKMPGTVIGATEQGPNSGQQLRDLEGLGKIIVGPEIESLHPIFNVTSCGQHQDRNIEAMAPQFTANIKSISAGELNVQKKDIETSFQCQCQTFLTVGAGLHEEPFSLQPLPEQKRQRRLIFHE